MDQSYAIQNPRAIAFYERCGFETVGTAHYGVGGMNDRVLVMKKVLDSCK